MGVEFDGIDLDEIAGSESAIIEVGAKAPDSDETKKDPVVEKPAGDEPPEDPNAVDLDFLANSGGEEEDIEGSKTTDKEGKENRVPAATPGKTGGSAATSSSQNTFTSLASALSEAGTLSTLDDEALAEITDASTLLSALEKQVKDSEYANLNEEQKNYLKALETGVPHDTFVHVKANASQYEKLDDNVLEGRIDLQTELIRRNFLTKGFTAEKASQYAGLAMKGDDPLKEAIDSRNALVAYENSKITEDMNARSEEQESNIAKAEQRLSALKTKLTETSEVIPGIKVNSPTREKIFLSMTTPTKVAGEEPQNAVMEKYSSDDEYKMRLHTMDVLTKGFTDFSKIKSTMKTSAIKKLEETVNSQTAIRTGGKTMSGNVVSTSQLDMANELRNLKL